jgi:hypothetical protein
VLCGQVFGQHVQRWIKGSEAALVGRCRQIEGGGAGTALQLTGTGEDGDCPSSVLPST